MILQPPACKMIDGPGACKGGQKGEAPKKPLGKAIRAFLGHPRGLLGGHKEGLASKKGEV